MREGRWKGVKKKDERRKSGGQWEGKRVEGGKGWRQAEGGKRKGAGRVRSRREEKMIRDEKACLRWRKYSRGLEALGLFQKSYSTH